MSLDLTKLSSVLQARIDALANTTEYKDLLLLSKAIEAAIGNAAVSDVNAAGAAQVSAVNAAGTTQVGTVNAAGTAKIAAINALDSVLKSGGTMAGALQVPSGTTASVGLQVGEAGTGLYRYAAGVLGVVAGAVEAFRVLATGCVTFLKAVRPTVISVAYSSTITLDLDAGNSFAVSAMTGSPTLANPTNIANAIGQRFVVMIPQDSTGGRVISFGSFWKFSSTPSQVTIPNTRAYLSCIVVSSSSIDCTYIGGWA